MIEYGITGYPLSSTRSPAFFNDFFMRNNFKSQRYLSFPLENINLFTHLIKTHKNLKGLNVTSPYKEVIMDNLLKIDYEAKIIGAVNVIKIERNNGKIITTGYNSDAQAFEYSLLKIWHNSFSSALIFGTGGAAKAVGYALSKLRIPFNYVSRTNKHNCLRYEELTPTIIKNNPLLINATPVGMPENNNSILNIDYNSINSNHYCYDLIYNPDKTKFLEEASKRGAKILNGENMFLKQAEISWQIWNL